MVSPFSNPTSQKKQSIVSKIAASPSLRWYVLSKIITWQIDVFEPLSLSEASRKYSLTPEASVQLLDQKDPGSNEKDMQRTARRSEDKQHLSLFLLLLLSLLLLRYYYDIIVIIVITIS